jgi:hypothetical protein
MCGAQESPQSHSQDASPPWFTFSGTVRPRRCLRHGEGACEHGHGGSKFDRRNCKLHTATVSSRLSTQAQSPPCLNVVSARRLSAASASTSRRKAGEIERMVWLMLGEKESRGPRLCGGRGSERGVGDPTRSPSCTIGDCNGVNTSRLCLGAGAAAGPVGGGGGSARRFQRCMRRRATALAIEVKSIALAQRPARGSSWMSRLSHVNGTREAPVAMLTSPSPSSTCSLFFLLFLWGL